MNLRERYGAGPLHLISSIAALSIAGYAVFEMSGQSAPIGFAIWFVAAALLHDIFAFPVYSLFGLLAGKASARLDTAAGAVNYVRVPAILSALVGFIWFPLILGLSSERYEGASGHSSDVFIGRWLLLSAILFGLSGLAYAVSLRRSAGAALSDDSAPARRETGLRGSNRRRTAPVGFATAPSSADADVRSEATNPPPDPE